jgi:dihydrofolate synthase / folylpolyglutamate synthase
MTYQQTIEFLFSQLPAYHRIGKAAYKDNLNNTISLDNYFGHPHKKYKTIHIAGTNGKGSVSHMLASVLQEAGYVVGLYTSPHLKDFRERIKVNGRMIREDDVVEFVERNRAILESLTPSFFEMSVAMAFDYFAKSNVQFAIIEVGLGGRLDSTNIIEPVLSVITNIGLDHKDLLGSTLEQIAHEKAGIIKRNVPVIIGESSSETMPIFISRAAENGSQIFFADERFSCRMENNAISAAVREFDMLDLMSHKKIKGRTALTGDYQSKNLQTVFCIMSILKNSLDFTDSDIDNGLSKVIANTGLNGRWQILGEEPLIICDTGHNKEAMEYIIAQIGRIKKTGLHMVIGFVNDKDLDSVLPLFPVDAVYYFTRASVPRAIDEEDLKSIAGKYGLTGESYHNVKTAMECATQNAIPSDMIFVGGSTFVVAEVM